jgi:hypothetical protein
MGAAGRRTRVAAALATAAATVLTGLAGVAGPAAAAPEVLYGHDVSWPQCPAAAGGYGLPMPPSDTDFVVIGLTAGLPFTTNPCLASQVRWARVRAVPTHGYTMAGFPTATQLTRRGDDGPWSDATRAGRLSNVGYAEARFAVARMADIGFDPPVVWIDVEPRSAQPWPGGSALRARENRLVVEGLMRGLRHAGYSYGLYSYLYGWGEITGGWRLPGVPVWATAGTLDYPTEARDRCTQPSFSRGRVYLSQWYTSQRDYNRTCPPYVFGPLRMPPSSLSNSTADLTGDWRADLLSTVAATGEVRVHPGRRDGTLRAARTLAADWSRFDLLETPGDLSGDGADDVLARNPTTGVLWLYRGTGRGELGSRTRLGDRWAFARSVVGAGDVTGDQVPDVLALGSAGRLWLYPGDGRGGLRPRTQVAQGWQAMRTVEGPGDLTGDGRADLVALDGQGTLWLYPGSGRGTLLPRSVLRTGWTGYDLLVGAGDLDSDRVPDLVARRTTTGELWLWRGTGDGRLQPRTLVGTGFGVSGAVF